MWIDLLRGRAEAVAFLQGLSDPPLVSAVTVAELYAGVRDGAERTALDGLIATVNVIPLDAAMAARGGLIRRDYAKSHGVGIADALIAATAEASGAMLVTLNRKHFSMLASVHVPYQKPWRGQAADHHHGRPTIRRYSASYSPALRSHDQSCRIPVCTNCRHTSG